MKHIKNIAWGALVALTLGYCLFCLADCGGGSTVAPPIVSDTIKPTVRVVPDSEYCKTIYDDSKQVSAVAVKSGLWVNGQTIKIGFPFGGTDAQKQYVRDAFAEWAKYANLFFVFPASGPYDIRVAFNANDGAWSTIGQAAKNVPQGQPTMNLGFRAELHELGHCIGLGHEMASPNSTLCYNKPVINAALKGSPNFWDQATIDYNVYAKYNPDAVNASVFDPKSIMCYSMPDSWLIYNPPSCPIKNVPQNTVLSEIDKSFIATIYPKSVPPPNPVNATITTAQRDNLRRLENKAQLYIDSVVIYSRKIFGI